MQEEFEDTSKLINIPRTQNAKKVVNQEEIKNQRINRRMNKIIKHNNITIFKNEEDKCAICLGDCENSSAMLPCEHIFCLGCIANWWITNSTCPFCRENFEYVIDCKGRKMKKEDLPSDILIEREDTLKCEGCWADIGEEPMRICFDCRSVYIHQRCLAGDELCSRSGWKCEECYENLDEEMEKKAEKKAVEEEKKNREYQCHSRIVLGDRYRQSQRIMSQSRVSFQDIN